MQESLGRWRLDPIVGRRFGRLSLGNRQRVGLAAALQHRPRVVVLDEPSSALDPAAVLIHHLALSVAFGFLFAVLTVWSWARLQITA